MPKSAGFQAERRILRSWRPDAHPAQSGVNDLLGNDIQPIAPRCKQGISYDATEEKRCGMCALHDA